MGPFRGPTKRLDACAELDERSSRDGNDLRRDWPRYLSANESWAVRHAVISTVRARTLVHCHSLRQSVRFLGRSQSILGWDQKLSRGCLVECVSSWRRTTPRWLRLPLERRRTHARAALLIPRDGGSILGTFAWRHGALTGGIRPTRDDVSRRDLRHGLRDCGLRAGGLRTDPPPVFCGCTVVGELRNCGGDHGLQSRGDRTDSGYVRIRDDDAPLIEVASVAGQFLRHHRGARPSVSSRIPL